MPLNPEPLWPIVLATLAERVPTWMLVVGFLVICGLLCSLCWTVLSILKTPPPGSSGDGGGGGCGGGGCGGGGDGG
jgi:hypothetical protein